MSGRAWIVDEENKGVNSFIVQSDSTVLSLICLPTPELCARSPQTFSEAYVMRLTTNRQQLLLSALQGVHLSYLYILHIE